MADPGVEGAAKARGAYFTPPLLAAWLAAWAIRGGAARVLEPACGDAAFLLAAAARLSALGAGRATLERQIEGIEIDPPSARRAASRLAAAGFSARVIQGDFFAQTPAPRFEAVIGNPPFVRCQDFTGTARARAQGAAREAGVRLSGQASSWAAFVVQASRFLVPGGRLALVLPAELLGVGYAAPVRRFLLERFARLRLVTFAERVFAGVAEEVVLLLAEGQGGAPGVEIAHLPNPQALPFHATGGEALAWTLHRPGRGEKWTPALLDAATLALHGRAAAGFVPLGAWGRTSLGAVTGANDFFALDAAAARRFGLGEADRVAISPPGSRHLSGLAFTRADWEGLAQSGAACWLACPRTEAAAPAWLAEGQRRGVMNAYKCRSRTPWWRVRLPPCPDLLLTAMNAEAPRLIANQAGVQVLNSLYGVVLLPGLAAAGRALLPLAFLNSVTLLAAEIGGRSYGAGLLKLEPREADRLPVPAPPLPAASLECLRPAVQAALAAGTRAQAVAMVDAVVLENLTSSERVTLREAWLGLATRRRARRRASAE